MRLYINVFFYLSVSIKMNFMVKIVGAFLAQRQPFCRFATFPLTGESPVCPPAGQEQNIIYHTCFCVLN